MGPALTYRQIAKSQGFGTGPPYYTLHEPDSGVHSLISVILPLPGIRLRATPVDNCDSRVGSIRPPRRASSIRGFSSRQEKTIESVARGFGQYHFGGLAEPNPRMVDRGERGPFFGQDGGCWRRWFLVVRVEDEGRNRFVRSIRQKETPRRQVIACLRDLTGREQDLPWAQPHSIGRSPARNTGRPLHVGGDVS